MDSETGAGLLHRLTSYTPDREWDVPVDDPRVRHDLTPNDPGTLPPPVKAYPADRPRIALPRDLPRPGVAATAVLAGQPADAQSLDAGQLGRILFLGSGVVRRAERRGMTLMFRAAGSAGARFPLEVYVSTHGVQGVPDGVHWYDPVGHALVAVGPAADGAATTIVITGVPWRTGWRYAERGWRHIYWDAGTMLAQVTAAAASAGFDPRLRTEFPDAPVRELVGADGVHEFPVALVTLGGGVPAIGPTGPAAPGTGLPPVEFPLCTAAQRAGELDTLGAAWPEGAARTEVPGSATLDEVILRRGSKRLMDRTATLPRERVEWMLGAALRGIDVPHFVVAHGIEDVAPGVYRWPDLDTPLAAGDHRDRLDFVCLGQTLGADAVLVVISATDPAGLDDRSYRRAQLAAGIVEGRLHLAAYALAAAATGMTFYDSELPELLRQPDDVVGLLFTCVGVGEYDSRSGGGPGEPVDVKPVTPRFSW